ncbi:C39 family peptidase [Gemella sp. zg-1178]|uniref:C39 family peptidase n=1 Tax=Gemella sp. zg-1178 TaxID=2840372 RepID=UPI001C03EA5A|nr:C39 family peptidase [Gemella sp. zg-1178]MBU0278104.1 C39 family peptidase [Gemella sp. zg-1178]
MKKYLLAMPLLIFIILLFFTGETINDSNTEIKFNRDNIIGVKQPYPFLQREEDVNLDLKEYANENTKAKYIADNLYRLPLTYRKMLANNKDVTDYIYGYLNGSRVPYSQGETVGLGRNYPLYIQWDRRWGYNKLGETDISIRGCGPTVVAMLLSGELKDMSITPDVISEIEDKAGYFTPDGTSWGFFKYIARYYKMNYAEIPVNKNSIDKTLKQNKPIIASVKPGKFTTVGHIILIVGIDKDGNYIINDPNSLGRTLKPWSYDELKVELRALWSISK